MKEQWQELKETITEMRDNDGTSTQQEVCRFLVNYMNILEKQMQEPKTGHWINGECNCPICGEDEFKDLDADIWADWQPNFCPNCGAKMEADKEGE